MSNAPESNIAASPLKDSATINEFTARAVITGALLGILFGAITVYVGLRSGLNISPSIPIAVLAITLLRRLGRGVAPYGPPTILENNIVQTTGSAGESVAAGVIFTLPALIFMGSPLEYVRVSMLAFIGGMLGIFFMIPLRRQLIIKEHRDLPYPEGTACAQVLTAGDKGGSLASKVFAGLGIGGVYTFFQNENLFAAWSSTPSYDPRWFAGTSLRGNLAAEYLGLGYIIGPRVAGTVFAGSALSWMVLMPAIKFFGEGLPRALYPGSSPIVSMSTDQLWASYIRFIAAGAVAASGLIAVMRTLPTVTATIRGELARARGISDDKVSRTSRDLGASVTAGGSLLLLCVMSGMLWLRPLEGASISLVASITASSLVIGFGFLFVVVSSRIVGMIGSSANPISGMTMGTLMAISLIFLLLGWRSSAFAALAVVIGSVVCIASSNAGNTSQDLKTGYLVQATPYKQQLALSVGVLTSVAVIAITLSAMNRGLEKYVPSSTSADLDHLPSGVVIESGDFRYSNGNYVLLNALGSEGMPDGKYLYNPLTRRIEFQWIPGIGSASAPAPQARLVSVLISGVLNGKLPWRLVFVGVALVIVIELLGINSLAFAVGSYLPFGSTLPIFVGGAVRWLTVQRVANGADVNETMSPGSLYASGLVAAGAVVGLGGILLNMLRDKLSLPTSYGKIGGSLTTLTRDAIAVLAFTVLSASLFWFGTRRMDKSWTSSE